MKKANNKKNGVYAIYWESDGNSSMTQSVQTDAPEAIKRMIAQRLLDDLNIKIRVEG